MPICNKFLADLLIIVVSIISTHDAVRHLQFYLLKTYHDTHKPAGENPTCVE